MGNWQGGVRDIQRSVGLKHPRSSRVGPVVFDEPRITRLVAALDMIRINLPPGTDRLGRKVFLEQESRKILEAHGWEVWGKDQTREWLLKASDGVKEYTKDLVYEDAEDRQVYEQAQTT
jgi:hypothetical protein